MMVKLFTVTVALLLGAAASAAAADTVDPALVGTWKLQWQRADFFWAVRPDGLYRMHGPGATRQLGKIEAKQGRFSLKSLMWADSGPYAFSNPDTVLVTGQLGPGTWKRVWTTANKNSKPPPGAGACGLLTEDEVSEILRAPVSGGMDPRKPGGCIYTSLFSPFDTVSVQAFPARRQGWYTTRKLPNPRFVDVPGVGEDAYIEDLNAGKPAIKILKGDAQFRITIALTPQATMDDVPYLMDLARAANKRLSGFTLPGPTGTQRAAMELEEQLKAQGWKGRMPPGASPPPQKGPKPFKGFGK